ncbi:MAG: TraR/DksA C4-type zinc finger protein [Gammaproteobacteria bacterium]|nr:TraR/DksA C4-type zinc finger protein [Gammaproteobacteria bacterium]
MTELNTERFRRLLEARRDALEELSKLNPDAARTVELDQTRVGRLSRMDALQGQAMAKATEQRRQLEATQINAALLRLDNGEYGYCVECDEFIGEGRLEIALAASRCIRCANRSEA